MPLVRNNLASEKGSYKKLNFAKVKNKKKI